MKLDKAINSVKANLLKKRRAVITDEYDDDHEIVLDTPLSDDELKYISGIIDQQEMEEEDAELILAIMRDHADQVEERLPYIITSFPNLAKNVYNFCIKVEDREFISTIILNALIENDQLTEFQLFWFGSMLDDYLIETSKASELISELYNHRSATQLTKAKILEIQNNKFGLPELRNQFLGSGQSPMNWIANWVPNWVCPHLARAKLGSKLGSQLLWFFLAVPLNLKRNVDGSI